MPTEHHTDHIKRQAAIGLIDQQSGLPAWAVDDSESVKAAGIASLDLWNALERLEQQVLRIRGNEELSEAGRKAGIARQAGMFVKVDVTIAADKLAGLERALLNARGVLQLPPVEGMSEVVREMRASEIRLGMSGASGIQVTEAALSAAGRGDLETLNAIFNKPGEPMIDDAGRAHAMDAYFAGSKAAEVSRVKRLESALRQFSGQVASARSRAAQLGAAPVDFVSA